jgi:hypothetical protein
MLEIYLTISSDHKLHSQVVNEQIYIFSLSTSLSIEYLNMLDNIFA